MPLATPRSSRLAAASACAGLAATLVVGFAPAATAADEPDPRLVAHYALDEMSGTVAADSSGNGRNGTYVGSPTLRGAAGIGLDGTDDYVDLPDNLMTGLDAITVTMDVLIDSTQATPYFIYALGNPATSAAGTGYLFSTGNNYRGTVSLTHWAGEQNTNSGAPLTRGTWHSIAYTLDGATDTATLYLDGVQVAQNTAVTIAPKDIGNGVTTANFIGKSSYSADRLLKGGARDFRIYDTALTSTEIADLAPTDAERVDFDLASVSLGNTSAVTSNLTLPTTGANGSTLAWSSSDPSIVAANGAVTRPLPGEGDATVTLTATATKGAESDTRTFQVTVLESDSPDAIAQADLNAIVIPNADDVRGNITLPTMGERSASAIAWNASPAGIVSTVAADGKAAGVVTRPAADTVVTLSATIPGTTATRDIAITVKAAPVDLDTDYTAGYLWSHFAAQGGYEKIFFGYSEDGLNWEKLNNNEPILANLAGDLGVRDPHLQRSAEGDKYWLIGTDLHAEGGGAGGSGWDQLNASQNLVVWESTDLVNWSDQRIVFAGFDRAGCVWAPESIYNEETGEYYVYWSARDQAENNTNDWALRVYLTKTRDFVTFSEPEIFASLNEQGDGATGPNIIDSSIAYENGVYYRFSTSDWRTVVDTATSLDGPWTTVIARGEESSYGLDDRMEGLTVYQLPDGTWAIMGDDGGYLAHTAPTLASLDFTQLTAGVGYSFDQRFRHGSVLRLSATEEAALLEAYGNEPVVEPEPEDLIAEYTFDDGTLADSARDGDLVKFGTAAVADDATQGKVLRLDGTSGGYAQLPTGLLDGRNKLTVSLDMKSDKTSGNFFSFAFGKDTDQYYFLRARGGDIRSAITQTSWQNESAVTGSVTSGAWHHYDVVFDGSTMKVYVDGALLGQNTSLTAKVSDLGTDVIGYLGRSFYSADGYFAGSYDNVRIYGRALTDAELLGPDQLLDVSLADPSVLKVDPIVDEAAHTVTFPVAPGTDLTALAPVFTTVEGVTTDPASGTVVDLTAPVEYTLDDEDSTVWTMSALEMRSPVLPGLYADPNIFTFGDTYYIYATSDGYAGWGGKEFYVWSSKDLVDWTRSEEPFLTLDGANGNVPWATGNAWAPTIIERDGKFYFYFSGHNATYNRKTIGVAVADSPEGPFVAEPTAMILNNEAVTSGQAIDPAAFMDPETGKYYLFWGNGGGTPVQAELGDDMTSIKWETAKKTSALPNFREGVFLNYREGTYHLTYAIDDTGSENYRVGYATSDSIDGPWTYRGLILEKDLSLGIKGPGHSSILNVPGTDDWYIVYHRFAIPGGDGNHRETTIDRLEIDPETGLFLPVTPTLTSVDPQEIVTTPSLTLTDIATNPFKSEIEWLAATGVTTGWATEPGFAEFRPLQNVNRDQMAAFLYRMSGSPEFEDPAVPTFADVPTTHVFYTEIEWLATQGITNGWDVDGVKYFRPATAVNRDVMAAFLYRYAGEPDFEGTAQTFVDVPAGHVFYDEIEWLATTGITNGWDVDGVKQFRPTTAVKRDVMAAFLYRYADRFGM